MARSVLSSPPMDDITNENVISTEGPMHTARVDRVSAFFELRSPYSEKAFELFLDDLSVLSEWVATTKQKVELNVDLTGLQTAPPSLAYYGALVSFLKNHREELTSSVVRTRVTLKSQWTKTLLELVFSVVPPQAPMEIVCVPQ